VTYTAAVALGLAGAVLLDLVALRTRLLTRGAFWAAYPIILVFQLISNGLLTGRGVVRYDPGAIIGWRIAYAPVEDLGFGFALVLATLSVWVRLGYRRADQRSGAGR
jgi:lycopene cyclase domain-containing protein